MPGPPPVTRQPYLPRVVDSELDVLLQDLPAIALEGPKAVGKTATALLRAASVLALDDPAQRSLLAADPARLDRLATPIVLDEWQRLPESWDLVRRSVDRDPRPGRFVLTGSAIPSDAPTHSGAGRIVSLRMRPMSLAERGLERPTVSLGTLLRGERLPVSGVARMRLPEYAHEVVASGFPAIRTLAPRARRAQLDGYLSRMLEHDFAEVGHVVRRPASLRAWLTAYAAATATTAAYEAILDAATPGEAQKPSKPTTIAYRDVLERLWLLDPVPAWLPSRNRFARLSRGPKHHLADPALAARLLGLGDGALVEGADTRPPGLRDGVAFGALFESLVTLSVRVYAQAAEARVRHFRDEAGRHEVDLVVERDDGRVVALEVKLGRDPRDADVAHLAWLREKLGGELLDAVIVTAGAEAYRRPDGIAVVPAALLGP